MNQLTQEDYKNLLVLINKATISGQEAVAVAVLQQKLVKLLEPIKNETKSTEKPNK